MSQKKTAAEKARAGARIKIGFRQLVLAERCPYAELISREKKKRKKREKERRKKPAASRRGRKYRKWESCELIITFTTPLLAYLHESSVCNFSVNFSVVS